MLLLMVVLVVVVVLMKALVMVLMKALLVVLVVTAAAAAVGERTRHSAASRAHGFGVAGGSHRETHKGSAREEFNWFISSCKLPKIWSFVRTAGLCSDNG
ncbi:unnamed protein product [Lampetra planeri]